jgi:hypothetical protein
VEGGTASVLALLAGGARRKFVPAGFGFGTAGGTTVEVVFVSGFAGAGMVMRVLQDGQLSRRPIQDALAKMCWPHLGQLNLKSFMAG